MRKCGSTGGDALVGPSLEGSQRTENYVVSLDGELIPDASLLGAPQQVLMEQPRQVDVGPSCLQRGKCILE